MSKTLTLEEAELDLVAIDASILELEGLKITAQKVIKKLKGPINVLDRKRMSLSEVVDAADALVSARGIADLLGNSFQLRCIGDYDGKALFLCDRVNWKIVEDNFGVKCLVIEEKEQ